MNPHYSFVAQRAGHRCEYCRAPEVIFNFPFEVEHVIPSSRDGTDDEANLCLACRSCNLFKGDQLTGLGDASACPTRLFHPRLDKWQEHFQMELETGTIQGLTDIGRATITQLQMNSELQRTARQQWRLLGLFP
jgi:hypothetical protein